MAFTHWGAEAATLRLLRPPARTKRVVTRGLMRPPKIIASCLLAFGTLLTAGGQRFDEQGCRITGQTSIWIQFFSYRARP